MCEGGTICAGSSLESLLLVLTHGAQREKVVGVHVVYWTATSPNEKQFTSQSFRQEATPELRVSAMLPCFNVTYIIFSHCKSASYDGYHETPQLSQPHSNSKHRRAYYVPHHSIVMDGSNTIDLLRCMLA